MQLQFNLHAITVELSNRTHMSEDMHIGQSVQAKDVALLPVLIYLIECQLCSTFCLWILTRACLYASVLHWCTADMCAPQCQQQRQQHAALHD